MGQYPIRLYFILALCLWATPPAIVAQESGEKNVNGEPEPEIKEKEKEKEKKTSAHKLDTIVVTGGKVRQNQQDAPMSITTLTGKDVKDAEIQSVRELDGYVPNLSIVERGSRYNTFYSIRGLGSTFFDEPSVALYVDDVPYSDAFFYDRPLYDIEQVEVLKGPQGALYGKNTQGGVIKITTRKPDNEWKVNTSAERGNYRYRRFTLSTGGPIADDLFYVGVSGMYDKRDGYLFNRFTGTSPDKRETADGRLHLRFTPGDNWDILLTGSGGRHDDGGFNVSFIDGGDLTWKRLNPLYRSEVHEVSYNYEGEIRTKTDDEALRVKYSGNYFDVVSISTRRKAKLSPWRSDGEYTLLDVAVGRTDHESLVYGQELRIQSPAESKSPFKWLVGGFYEKKVVDFKTGFELHDVSFAPSFNGPNELFTDLTEAELSKNGHAGFAQTTLTLWDKLGVTAGGRYSFEKRNFSREQYQEFKRYAPSGYSLAGVSLPLPYIEYAERRKVSKDIQRKASDRFWTPRYIIDYKLLKDMKIYGSAAKGFKNGGFSTATEVKELIEFFPEVSWTYEGGVKSKWFNEKLQLNAAYFQTHTDDYQVQRRLGALGQIAVVNAAEVIIKGSEGEIIFSPIKRLQFRAALGHLDARYKTFHDTLTNEYYDGKRVQNIPQHNYSAAIQYVFGFGLFLRGEALSVGRTDFNETNNKSQGSYTLFNAKIGYKTRHLELYIFGKNLGDKKYYTTQFPYQIVRNVYVGAPGAPATYGFKVSYRY